MSPREHRPLPWPFVLALALAPALACPLPEPEPSAPPPLVAPAQLPGYPTLVEPCAAPVAEPSHLVVTSTDFHTGAVGLVELDTHTVLADLALASSDAVPVVAEGRVFVINRYGFDYIDELDPETLELIHEWPVRAASSEASANPHALILDGAERAWVTLYGAGELQAFEFPTLQDAKVRAALSLDLSAYADADGVPELGLALRCGEVAFVSAERIDRKLWVPVADTVLIPVSLSEPAAIYDLGGEGPGAIHLRGRGVGAWRLDPSDPAGHTILVLNSGLERVDLATGTTEWLVPAQRFVDAGYERLQLSGFDLDSHGRPWLTAATADYASFALLRIDGEGEAATLEPVVDDLHSVTGALEIVGDVAYVADTTIGASGLRAFDLAAEPVAELPDSPLALGLPPQSIAPLTR